MSGVSHVQGAGREVKCVSHVQGEERCVSDFVQGTGRCEGASAMLKVMGVGEGH